jgi:hypothetical protein
MTATPVAPSLNLAARDHGIATTSEVPLNDPDAGPLPCHAWRLTPPGISGKVWAALPGGNRPSLAQIFHDLGVAGMASRLVV